MGYGCDVASEQCVKDTFSAIERDFGGKVDVRVLLIFPICPISAYPTIWQVLIRIVVRIQTYRQVVYICLRHAVWYLPPGLWKIL